MEHLINLIKRETNTHVLEKKIKIKSEINKKVQKYVLEILKDYKKQLKGKRENLKEKMEFFRHKSKRKFEELENEYSKTENKLWEISKIEQNLNIKGCNKNFFLWHTYFWHVFNEKGGFDIVIANPPYGVKVNIFNKKRYKYYDKQKNSASLFIELATHISHKKSILTYIVPKSLTFSEGWHKPRELILNENTLKTIIDVSKAFKRVKLEQVITIYEKIKSENDYKFLTGDNWNSKIEIKGYSTKSLAENLNTIPIYINNEKLRILEKLLRDSILLDTISKTSRGLPFQSKVSNNGNLPILRGKNIKKYAIYGEIDKVSLTKEELRKKKVKEILNPKIVSQNIVAHVMNPYDKIIIMATFDKDGILTLDTVMNTFITDENYSYQYILALLNSKLAEWYYYWFVYNRAIRTMHFDKYYMGKLPIKKISINQQKSFIELVDKILELISREDYQHRPELQAKVQEYTSQIDRLVYKLYNLTDEEIERIERRLKN